MVSDTSPTGEVSRPHSPGLSPPRRRNLSPRSGRHTRLDGSASGLSSRCERGQSAHLVPAGEGYFNGHPEGELCYALFHVPSLVHELFRRKALNEARDLGSGGALRVFRMAALWVV